MMKENEIISPYAVAGLRRTDMPQTLRKTDAQKIVDATCEHFGLDRVKLFSRSRKKDIIYPRQCAMYLMTQHTAMTLKEIAASFGKVAYDHTSVLYNREAIRNRIYVNDATVKEDTDAIYYLATNDLTIKSTAI